MNIQPTTTIVSRDVQYDVSKLPPHISHAVGLLDTLRQREIDAQAELTIVQLAKARLEMEISQSLEEHINQSQKA